MPFNWPPSERYESRIPLLTDDVLGDTPEDAILRLCWGTTADGGAKGLLHHPRHGDLLARDHQY